jgi:Fur family peroxide stress response transcriptional regulator
MADPKTRYDALLAKFREQGYRITPQRLALLRVLAASEGHPSATQIHEQLRGQFPTMSLATVYKTLNILKEMGEVLELGFGDGDNRYDGNMPFPHPHLICINCRQIIDPEVPEFRALAQHIATISGFQIVSHRLDFFGICPDCQSDESN